MKDQINETERNDARASAPMMRVGIYRAVHVKRLRSQKLRTLLSSGQLLRSKAIDIDNDLCATLRNFGLKVGANSQMRLEARIREFVQNRSELTIIVEPMLAVRAALREQVAFLHTRLLSIVPGDEVYRRFMTIPGVGPVVAMSFRATIDVRTNFKPP